MLVILAGTHANLASNMKCDACGHANIDGARFCANCGGLMPVEPEKGQDAMIGQLIGGRYRITGVLGEGGMGIVYVGEQQMGSTVRKVAIKTLHQHLSKDPSVLARFTASAAPSRSSSIPIPSSFTILVPRPTAPCTSRWSSSPASRWQTWCKRGRWSPSA